MSTAPPASSPLAESMRLLRCRKSWTVTRGPSAGRGASGGGPIEHPLRQLNRPARLVVLEAAAEHGEVTSPDSFDDDHLPTEPGVPGVMDLAGLGTVGLLVALLYNTVRPHSAVLGYRPPAPEAFRPWTPDFGASLLRPASMAGSAGPLT